MDTHNTNIKLSIIIPVYNVGEWLRNCLDSVSCHGSVAQALELICIDDGSTDNSLEILCEYERKVPNMRVISKPNAGVCATKNLGLSEAAGEYVWFIDSDDRIAYGGVEAVINALENEDLLILGYIRIDESNFETNRIMGRLNVIRNIEVRTARPINMLHKRGEYPQGDYVPCIVIKRELLLNNGIRFNEKLTAREDTLFCYQLRKVAKYASLMPHAVYYYRMRASSVMHSRDYLAKIRYFDSVAELLSILVTEKPNGKADRNLLKKLITNLREDIALCAARLDDEQFERLLLQLKNSGHYPYNIRAYNILPHKHDTLRTYIAHLLIWLLPLEPWLRLYRKLMNRRKKRIAA